MLTHLCLSGQEYHNRYYYSLFSSYEPFLMSVIGFSVKYIGFREGMAEQTLVFTGGEKL